MEFDDNIGIAERTPEALLDFWLGPLRTAADASRENWKRGMLKWRVGPFARSAENQNYLRAQREWCEQLHREGLAGFFRDPVWNTPKGFLAKLIVFDQFPRSVYRGTACAYANDSLTASMSSQACEDDQEFTHYNVIERFWIYLPLSHAEDLKLQERSIEKLTRWSTDLIEEAPPERRRINEFVGWSFVKAFIEHSEALLLFDRFPHRNAVMQRTHRGGEPRYLADTLRPLWSFTQPPNPEYFALLGALHKELGDRFDENRVTREALAGLLRAAGLSPEDPGSPMEVFNLTGDDTVPYTTLYRHLLLPEQARTLNVLRRTPQVAGLATAVKRLVLKNGEDELDWPPRSAKHSVEQVIDVAALNALVRGGGSPRAPTGKVMDGGVPRDSARSREPHAARSRKPVRRLSLTVRNESSEVERVATAVDEFADGHRFPEADRFQIQLCLEEILMYIVEHGYDDSAIHRIAVHLEMNEGNRNLAIRTVDDSCGWDPEAYMFQPGRDTIGEENVLDSLGLHLVRSYVDNLSYRRENGWNYLDLSKTIGV